MRDTKAEILTFWFEETDSKCWFQQSDAFDTEITKRFMQLYKMAADGIYDGWKNESDGCLALCLLLDQFPRNMFRGTSKAFETDEKALMVARHALSKNFDSLQTPIRRRFLYLPFEHSEALADQIRSVELFAKAKDEDPVGYDYAVRHKDVIEKFGRFPHRNKVLGRETTAEEQAWLDEYGGF